MTKLYLFNTFFDSSKLYTKSTMYFKISLAVCFVAALSYYYEYDFSHFTVSFSREESKSDQVLFTEEELSKFNGVDSEFLYLSIMGKVYDVTKGTKHYGPDANYHIFIGRDASRSFITGEFSETSKELDDISQLAPNDLIGLDNWVKMYDEQYVYKGKLIGRYYDRNGMETDYSKIINIKLESAKSEKLAKDRSNIKYPPCNVEWDANTGSRVWCSKKSGGISRDWEGVPRLLYSPGLSEPHCVCLNANDETLLNNANLKEYKGCGLSSTSCYVKN